ncbi:MAG TPA: hypothetical protein VGV93_11005 [Acidimicrobiales bacterium]|nr:hypothetical protein [Acidimicrobiales bacterium]
MPEAGALAATPTLPTPLPPRGVLFPRQLRHLGGDTARTNTTAALPVPAGLLSVLLIIGAAWIVVTRRDALAVLLGCMLLFLALTVVAIFTRVGG